LYLRVTLFDVHDRLTDPWFDKECRDAKRLTRRLERVCTAASRRSAAAPATSAAATEAAAARTAWYSQRPAACLPSTTAPQVHRVLARQDPS